MSGFTYDADEYREHLYDNFKGEKMLDDEYDDEEVELVDNLDDQIDR
jgi:hypothetical protein